MRVLSVASEVYPLIKTGGLADVAGALPPALAAHGVEMRTLLPGYRSVMARLSKRPKVLHRYEGLLGVPARLLAAKVEGLDLIVLDAPSLYDRPGGPYGDEGGKDHPDNWLRFAALSRAGADVAGGLLADFAPDLVQAHDWQAAMTAAYMKFSGITVPSMVTVHNLAFQGHFPAEVFGGLDLPAEAFAMDGVEYYGGVGFLKAGLECAWAVTTVSPTYAREIMTPDFGMGLDGLMTRRADTLFGIVNGIDTEVWNPETDPHLTANYSAKSLKGRKANRRELDMVFGLDPGGPLFIVVSRLTWQKGMDLLAEAADDLVAAGARLAVLGTGDAALEGAFHAAAARHRGRIGFTLGYDEPLAHLMQGGADAILVPSRFEPCGLTQLYGLRYGCVPVVARTGGLADTVIDANAAALGAKVATGLLFEPMRADALRSAVRRIVSLHADRAAWTSMQRQAMRADVSWEKSAALYADLYAALIEGSRT